jgi:hypothetical protein
MGKGTATTWYIGSWVVWVVALVSFSVAYRFAAEPSGFWLQDRNLTGIATIIQMTMLVMVATWIGTLIRLARLRRWAWFAGVLTTQMVGAGILGMVVYAGLGPEDEPVSRPGAASP